MSPVARRRSLSSSRVGTYSTRVERRRQVDISLFAERDDPTYPGSGPKTWKFRPLETDKAGQAAPIRQPMGLTRFPAEFLAPAPAT